MRYDFTKVREYIRRNGKTLREMQDLTGVPYQTFGRAIATDRAHQSTALLIAAGIRKTGFPLKYEELLVQPRRSKSA